MAGLADLFTDMLTPIFHRVYPIETKDAAEPGDLDARVNKGEIWLLDIDVRDDAGSVVVIPMELQLLSKVPQITKEIKEVVGKTIQPTIKNELLEQYNISGEDFLFKVLDVSVNPHVTVTNYKELMLFVYISVEFRLSVEDISALAPGGRAALRLKFLNLCRKDGRYPEEELRSWAVSLGIPKAEWLGKEELCEAIRQHYEF